MPWDAATAITYLQSHAQPHSTSYCAQYTREAINAGGVKLEHQTNAKDYGSSLTAAGFAVVPSSTKYTPRAGDVAVIQSIKGHPHGHMTMYDGKHWISDYVQPNGMYPAHVYEKAKALYTIYRYPGVVVPAPK